VAKRMELLKGALVSWNETATQQQE
jgi:hypothetical protein